MTHESIVLSEGVIKPKAAYAHAVKAADFVFVSGQGAMDSTTQEYVRGGIKEQTHQTIYNIEVILKKTGLGLIDIIKITAYLRNINDYSGFNEVYSEFFKNILPARTTIQAILPNDRMLVEIEAIAMIRKT